MKSNDNNSLFEVFKPGVRDDLSFGAKLWYWFTNVYLYHFGKISLFALFGILVVTFVIVDIVNSPDFDTGFIIAGDTYVSYEQEQGLREFFASVVSDANGDGEITIIPQALCTSAYDSDLEGSDLNEAERYDDFVEASKQKLEISFADDQFLVYIMDKKHMDAYVQDGAMEPLANYGIVADDPYCIPVGESAIFKELGIVSTPGNGWYAAIKVRADTRMKEKMTAKYEQSAAVLRALMF